MLNIKLPKKKSIDTRLNVRPLSRSDLPVDTVKLARFLIGKILVREFRGKRLAGRIVETEAYPVGDAAGHAWRGCTRANRSLFLERGRAYMYFIYGSCWCVNVTSEQPDIGGGVLIRAIEPLEGIASMRRARGIVQNGAQKVARDIDIARGPGRLAQAMRLDGKFDGVDPWRAPRRIMAGRVGAAGGEDRSKHPNWSIARGAFRRLRFLRCCSPFVSGPAGPSEVTFRK